MAKHIFKPINEWAIKPTPKLDKALMFTCIMIVIIHLIITVLGFFFLDFPVEREISKWRWTWKMIENLAVVIIFLCGIRAAHQRDYLWKILTDQNKAYKDAPRDA